MCLHFIFKWLMSVQFNSCIFSITAPYNQSWLLTEELGVCTPRRATDVVVTSWLSQLHDWTVEIYGDALLYPCP